MKRAVVLVVGGAGYVGSHTVRVLLRHGLRPVVFDNLSTGHRGAVPPAVPFLEGDLLDASSLDRAFRRYRVAAVFHFAARALVSESVRNPALYYRENVTGTQTLLTAMLGHGVRRIVFSSTAAVYGHPKKQPIREEAPKAPVNPYGRTKWAIEGMLQDFAAAYGLRAASLRYFNAAGADPEGEVGEDHDPETHLIPNVLRAALDGRRRVRIFGDDYPTPDGTCVRDYVHVTDLAEAHVLALRRLAREACVAYNLGTGRGYTVQEVVAAARAVTGRPIRTVVAPRRPGDPPVLVAAATRARRELGWRPRLSGLKPILRTAWAWHRSHPRGFRS